MRNAALIIMRVVVLLIACTMLMSGILIVKEASDGEETTAVVSDNISDSTEPQTTPDQSEATSEQPVDEETTTDSEVSTESTETEELYLVLTPEEKKILATLIRLECGGSSYECQMAVASVVVNRMKYTCSSLRTVVFAKNQFSPSRLINKETGDSNYPPSAQHWQVVEDICKNGPTLPYYVLYFRGGHYHSWGVPYVQIDTTFFSYSPKHM